jgi:hypothetical protein
MRILGKKYNGECLKLPVPLGLDRTMLHGITTEGQRSSALHWLRFWHASVGRAIEINRRKRKPVVKLARIRTEYGLMIRELGRGSVV